MYMTFTSQIPKDQSLKIIGCAKIVRNQLYLVRWNHKAIRYSTWETSTVLRNYFVQKSQINNAKDNDYLFVLQPYRIKCSTQIELIQQKQKSNIKIFISNNQNVQKILYKKKSMKSTYYQIKWKNIIEPQWIDQQNLLKRCQDFPHQNTNQNLIKEVNLPQRTNQTNQIFNSTSISQQIKCKLQQDDNLSSTSRDKSNRLKFPMLDKVIGKKIVQNNIYYLLKWKNKPVEYSTWVSRFDYNLTSLKFTAFNKQVRGNKLPYFTPQYKYLQKKHLKMIKKQQRADFSQKVLQKIIGKRNQGKSVYYLVKKYNMDFKDAQWYKAGQIVPYISQTIIKFNSKIKDYKLPYLDLQYINAMSTCQETLQKIESKKHQLIQKKIRKRDQIKESLQQVISLDSQQIDQGQNESDLISVINCQSSEYYSQNIEIESQSQSEQQQQKCGIVIKIQNQETKNKCFQNSLNRITAQKQVYSKPALIKDEDYQWSD